MTQPTPERVGVLVLAVVADFGAVKLTKYGDDSWVVCVWVNGIPAAVACDLRSMRDGHPVQTDASILERLHTRITEDI